MKQNDNLQEIKNVLEAIRKEHYPEISADVINTIVDIQFTNQESDSRVAGRSATHQAIKQYVEVNS